MTTVGSLCTGYGGIELALAEVMDVEPLWFADPDPASAALLEHRYPHIPNLGDLTAVDWRAIRRVDLLAFGFPCTDISAAGLQAGLAPDTRSGLWFPIATAIKELRPALVVIENVRNLLNARGAPPTPELIAAWAQRDRYARVLTLIEHKLDRAEKRAQRDRIRQLDADRARIMGRHRRAVAAAKYEDSRIVRAIGTVLGDLADLGFDAEWCVLPASGVDAPHQRSRVVIVAADSSALGWGSRSAGHEARRSGGSGRPDDRGGSEPAADAAGDGRGEGRPQPARLVGGPDAAECGDAAADTDGERRVLDWAGYRPAIQRWERVLGRPAPAPTVLGSRGGRQLSPLFVEWMMGLPEGWVTGVPGLTRNQKLKLLGNGVVPRQIAAALRHLLPLLARVSTVAA